MNLTRLEEPDPLIHRLSLLLMPEDDFSGELLEVSVEMLRQVGNRGLASSIIPDTRGISIVLIASPEQRNIPVRLQVVAGMSVLDALIEVARQCGMMVTNGVLGLLVSPADIALFIRDHERQPCEPVHPLLNAGPLTIERRLALISQYPALGVTNSRARRAFASAWETSEKTPEAASRIAAEIVGGDDYSDCCVEALSFFLPGEAPAEGT